MSQTSFHSATDENYFRFLYTAPWVRCTPYLVGILSGWIYWSFGDEIVDWGKRQNEVSPKLKVDITRTYTLQSAPFNTTI